MTGTIINGLSIILGALLGAYIIRSIPPKVHSGLLSSIGLTSILIGLKSAWNADILITIVSLALGAAIGEILGIEHRLQHAAARAEATLSRNAYRGSFTKGLVTASLMYCTGAMAIMGPLENGLTGRLDTLLAKSALDGIASIILGSALGVGVAFAAIPVLLYQGAIALTASRLQAFFTPEVVAQLNGVGGLLIAGIGLNLLNATQIRIANLLPALGVAALLISVRAAL
ncbi:MAG: DUF554 domain-containing protein [Bacillota bacterium]|nr:DUF554 domain-containing protein [Bacillota bacterium]